MSQYSIRNFPNFTVQSMLNIIQNSLDMLTSITFLVLMQFNRSYTTEYYTYEIKLLSKEI